MLRQFLAATPADCLICGGPCREPFKLPPIHDRYPFLPPEVIAMTQQRHEPEPEPEELPIVARRNKRLAENRARRLAEDRARHADQDRAASVGRHPSTGAPDARHG